MSDAPYLVSLADELSANPLPAIHRWRPSVTRDINLRIARNGDWYFEGSRIDRSRMVRLFSSVLRMDDGQVYLVTPQERLRIVVEDAPFTAVLLEQRCESGVPELLFTTNLGDQISASEQHPITIRYAAPGGEPSPYLLVRDQLLALISRTVFLQLAECSVVRNGVLGVESKGCFMPLDDGAVSTP